MKAQREPAHAGMSFSERGHPTRRSTLADAEVSQPGGTYAPTRLANSERSTYAAGSTATARRPRAQVLGCCAARIRQTMACCNDDNPMGL